MTFQLKVMKLLLLLKLLSELLSCSRNFEIGCKLGRKIMQDHNYLSESRKKPPNCCSFIAATCHEKEFVLKGVFVMANASTIGTEYHQKISWIVMFQNFQNNIQL